MKQCIDASVGKDLLSFVFGELSSEDEKRFSCHLEKCDACRTDPLFDCIAPEIGCLVHLYGTDLLDNKQEIETVVEHLRLCPACQRSYLAAAGFYEFLKKRNAQSRQRRQKSTQNLIKQILRYFQKK